MFQRSNIPYYQMAYLFASSCTLPTASGDFEMRVYKHSSGGDNAIALVARINHGSKRRRPADNSEDTSVAQSYESDSVLIRVQDQCMTSEIFGSLKCDCKQQLDHSMEIIQVEAARRYAALRASGSKPHFASQLDKESTPRTDSGPGTSASDSDSDAERPVSTDVPVSGWSLPSRLHDVVGLVVYLLQEGRGIGLAAKIAAYALQEQSEQMSGQEGEEGWQEQGTVSHAGLGARSKSGLGLDTVDANRALGLPDDTRSYGAVRDILEELGLVGIVGSGNGSGSGAAGQEGIPQSGAGARSVATVRPLLLLTNNPHKMEGVAAAGVPLAGRLPCAVPPVSPLAAAYLRTKAGRMGHVFPQHVLQHMGTGAAGSDS